MLPPFCSAELPWPRLDETAAELMEAILVEATAVAVEFMDQEAEAEVW